MKILMIHEDQRAPGQGGGAESLLRDQTIALEHLGHEVKWWHGGNIQRTISEFKPDVCHLMTFHNFLGFRPLQYIQENDIPHLIHVQDYWPFCNPRMLLINGDQGCAAVRGVCDNSCGGKAASEILEIVNQSFVVAGNEYTADIYRRNGLRCDAVVELGVDVELFQPDKSKRDPEVSIYTATAWPDQLVKGLHIVRQAIKGLPVGVNLITGVPRMKVAEGLKRAHVFVFPSCYEETFGLCLCEAMASGCACIASDVAGARAQIEHLRTGMLVPPRDPMALREAIEYMMDSDRNREEIGLNAFYHVQEEHSLEAMGQRWVTAYQEVLNG